MNHSLKKPVVVCAIPTAGRGLPLKSTVDAVMGWAEDHKEECSTVVVVISDRNEERPATLEGVDWVKTPYPMGQHRAILEGFRGRKFDWGVALEDDTKEDAGKVLDRLWETKRPDAFSSVRKVQPREWWKSCRTWLVRRIGFGIFSVHLSALLIADKKMWRQASKVSRVFQPIHWMVVGDKLKWKSYSTPLVLESTVEKTTYDAKSMRRFVLDVLRSWCWRKADDGLFWAAASSLCVGLTLAVYSSSEMSLKDFGKAIQKGDAIQIIWPLETNAQGECEVWDMTRRKEVDWFRQKIGQGRAFDLRKGVIHERVFVYSPNERGLCD